MEQINVQDKTITTSRVVKSIEIDSIDVKLNISARMIVKLLDENNGLVSVEVINLTGDDYQNWGNNDQYVIDYALNQLSLTKV
jgi:hypothetical protein